LLFYLKLFKVIKCSLLSFGDFIKLIAYFVGGSDFIVWAEFTILYSIIYLGSIDPCFAV